MSKILEVNSADFDREVIEASKNGKVLVDFHASWCGPCRQVAPLLDELSEENDEIKFVKIDVDKNTELMTRYGISSIPTLLLFKNGEINQMIGARPKKSMQEFIDS